MNICLKIMTKDLAREYFRDFIPDPALMLDGQIYKPYKYSVENADATVERHDQLGRVYLAIVLDDGKPIGEIVLKKIDREKKHCTMGISLQADRYKNQGYGTEAERQALRYAFDEMKMDTVFADSVLKNTRSQHVLQKVGFRETHRDEYFVYYRCDRESWTDIAPKHP